MNLLALAHPGTPDEYKPMAVGALILNGIAIHSLAGRPGPMQIREAATRLVERAKTATAPLRARLVSATHRRAP